MIRTWQSLRGSLFGMLCMLGLVFGPGLSLDPDKRISQYYSQSWSTEHGLPQSTVYCGLQTSDGFMWLGTQEGLARFDGQNFQVFNRASTGVFLDNNMSVLFEDRQGVLWVGTDKGLYFFQNDQVIHLGKGSDYAEIVVWSIVEQSDNSLWVATQNKGILIVRNGKVETAPASWNIENDVIYDLAPISAKATLVAAEKGLGIIENGELRWFGKKEGYDFGIAYVVEVTQDGAFWAALESGLLRYKAGEFTHFDSTNGLPYENIYSLYGDQQGALWIGADYGLVRFRDGQFESEIPNFEISFNPVNQVWEDQQGNLWVGRSNNGVFQFCDVAIQTYSQQEGLVHNMVRAAVEDSEGAVWIGTERGLSIIKDSKLTSVTKKDGLPDDRVVSLAMDPVSGIWVGGREGNIFHYDKGKVKAFQLNSPDKPQNLVRTLVFDLQGRLWIGAESGLTVLENGVLKRPSGPLAMRKIHSIHCDASGTIWVGIKNRAGYFEKADMEAFRELSLPKKLGILSFHHDSQGQLWMGTYGEGLLRFDGANIIQISKEEGLFDHSIFSIVEHNGYLWMSGNRGIFKVALEQLNAVAIGRQDRVDCENFGIEDGMKSSECNGGSNPAGMVDSKGNLWFATTRGVAKLNPNDVHQPLSLPTVKLLYIEQAGDRLGQEDLSNIRLGHDQLVFVYSSPSFGRNQKVRFRYRLTGFQNDWQYVGERRAAFYNHLPPGDYVFEAAAAYETGEWSPATTKTYISIKKVSHSSWWLVWGGIALLWGLVCWKLVRKAKLIRKKADQTEAQIEHSKGQLQRLDGSWAHLEKEYLSAIVHAGMGEMAGKVLISVNRGLGDIQHRILAIEEIIRGQKSDQKLLNFKTHLRQASIPETEEDQSSEKHEASVLKYSGFVEVFQEKRLTMLKTVVTIRDEIHRIGEMVEVQQDYAILENEIGTVDIAVLINDTLRIHGPYLNKRLLEFVYTLPELPPFQIQVLKCFLIFCGILRHIGSQVEEHLKKPRKGTVEIQLQDQETVAVTFWAPAGLRLLEMRKTKTRMTFLEEVQWLLDKTFEGALKSVQRENQDGVQVLIKVKPAPYR